MIKGSRFTSQVTELLTVHVDVRKRYTHNSAAMNRKPEIANTVNVLISIANNIPIVLAA